MSISQKLEISILGLDKLKMHVYNTSHTADVESAVSSPRHGTRGRVLRLDESGFNNSIALSSCMYRSDISKVLQNSGEIGRDIEKRIGGIGCMSETL